MPNLRTTPDSLPTILEQDTIDLFARYKVYTKEELKSRSAPCRRFGL